MKICLIHNFYQQPGGEDRVYANEKALLASHGHTVLEFTRHNDEIKSYSGRQKLALFAKTTYNRALQREFARFLQQHRPDILHFHNTFPLLSPALLLSGNKMGLPVVQSLHNYRLFCANGLFFRAGKVCEACYGKTVPWPALQHACYRDSRAQSAAVVSMLGVHHLLRTWQRRVDAFIALTEFGRRKFVEGGFSAEKFYVKPHFVDDISGEVREKENYFVYVGRVSSEKGLFTLLQAWRQAGGARLKIIGDGPMLVELKRFAAEHQLDSVEFLGRLPKLETQTVVQKARCLLLTSECYETFGLVAAEAFACGTPVIAANIGAIAEVITDRHTGLHFTPGDAADLAEKVRWAREHPEEMAAMGRNARREYEDKYTAEKNYLMLMKIYQEVVTWKRH